MDFLHQIFNVAPPPVLYGIGAIVVSFLLQKFKAWLSLESDKVITFVLIALSFIMAAIDYIVNTVSTNPTVLGKNTAVIIGLATVAYRYLVKPADQLAKDVKQLRQSKVAETVTASTVVTPALVETPVAPDQPLPVTPINPSEFPG